MLEGLTPLTSGWLAPLETTVITPRPGWQNRLLSADPFLMQCAACKLWRVRPEKFSITGAASSPIAGKLLHFDQLRQPAFGKIFSAEISASWLDAAD